uniref:RYamide receptor-like n=1 Tax=Dermatophagoides pteronyssinus TaxID=6956 RepID=A0A6P6YGJ4_DERPT|nr:RYamide receptor-like [Dermatophagoides pteronyssinus]
MMNGKRCIGDMRKFIVNLSIADILMAIFTIPFTYTNYMLGRWIFISFMCPIVNCAQLTTIAVSIYTLIAIAIDRYVAIMHPLRQSISWFKRHRTFIVILIWISGVCLGITQLIVTETYTFIYNGQQYIYCGERWKPESIEGRLYTIFIFSTTFAIPMSTLCIIYTAMGWKIFRYQGPEYNQRLYYHHHHHHIQKKTSIFDDDDDDEESSNQCSHMNYHFVNNNMIINNNISDGGMVRNENDMNIMSNNDADFKQNNNIVADIDHNDIQFYNNNDQCTDNKQIKFFPSNHLIHCVQCKSKNHCQNNDLELNVKYLKCSDIDKDVLILNDKKFDHQPLTKSFNTITRINSSDSVQQQQQQQQQQHSTKFINTRRYRILKILITIISVFTICWLPIQLFNILIYFKRNFLHVDSSFKYYAFVGSYFFCHWISMAHSFMNPIIYSFMSKNFRSDLKTILLKLWNRIKIYCHR